MTGYPAFAIEDSRLREATEEKVRGTLEGEKGYKRFLRDSYLTVREGARESGDTAAGDTSVRLLSVCVCVCLISLSTIQGV